jgi:hypothetical protein
MSQAIQGINPTKVYAAAAVPEFSEGDVGGYDDPVNGYQEFIFAKAGAAITGAGYVCVFNTPSSAVMISITATTPGTKGPGARVGVAMAAIENAGWGWLQIYGKGTVRTLASAAVGTRLNSTGTDGCLDDDGTAGSEQVSGVVLNTATGGAQANNSDSYLSYPVVLVTL